MSPTRKPVRVTIALTAAGAPRAAKPIGSKIQAYPTAAELLAGSSAWREWLEQSLRAVLRPVAFAGAVGLAATVGAGCGGSGGDGVGPTTDTMNMAGGQVAVQTDGNEVPDAADPKPPEPGSMIAPGPLPVPVAGTQSAVLPPPEPIAVPGGTG